VINTLVKGLKEKGNFIVTATDPVGPWSEPYWLEDAPGIDPSLLFDDDRRVWYTGNRIPPQGEGYRGEQQDRTAPRCSSYDAWVGRTTGPWTSYCGCISRTIWSNMP
jgi:beta-xylosidase